MLSQKVLELVMHESETMIIEWVNVGRTPRPEPGFSVIDGYIDEYLTREGYSGTDKRQKLKANVRAFIREDMSIMGW